MLDVSPRPLRTRDFHRVNDALGAKPLRPLGVVSNIVFVAQEHVGRAAESLQVASRCGSSAKAAPVQHGQDAYNVLSSARKIRSAVCTASAGVKSYHKETSPRVMQNG